MIRVSAFLLLLLIPALAFSESKKEKRVAKKKAFQMSKEDSGSYEKLPSPQNIPPVKINTNLQHSSDKIKEYASVIDQYISKKLKSLGKESNPRSSDEVFVRRSYLDIIGRIPTLEESKSFSNNRSPNKRAELIDQLTISNGYRSHQFNWFADMFRIKSGVKRVNYASYERWFKDQIKLNRPWNELVYDLLTAEGRMPTTPAVGYLQRDRGMPLDSISNTLTLFLGANVSCAQCHDHPLADWTQRDFYELAAFFGSTYVNDLDPRKIGKRLMDKKVSKQDIIALAAPNYAQVKTLPAQELTFPEDYAYDDAKPGEIVKPRFVAWQHYAKFAQVHQDKLDNDQNLRKHFATWMTHPDHPRFAVTIANRVWKNLFGIAVQEPINDLDDFDNASNPELLIYLGKLLVKLNFDLRDFQRVLLNTKAYHAASNITPDMGDISKYDFSGPTLRRMSAAQTWDSCLVLVDGPRVDDIHLDQSHRVTRFELPQDNMENETVYQHTLLLKANSYIGKTKSKSNSAEYPKGMPPNKLNGYTLTRASESPQPQADAHFLRMFGQSSRDLMDDESREGNIPQTLMLMNGDIQELMTNSNSKILEACEKIKKIEDKIHHLYNCFYSRKATKKEIKVIQSALDKGIKFNDVSWAIFNSPEFLFIQ